MDCAIIILAAGSSARLGRPKQLLAIAQTNMLSYMVKIAKMATNGPVVLVLGANAAEIVAATNLDDVTIVVNHGWQEGMSSSLRCALNKLLGMDHIKGAIILVSDQPFVNVPLLQQLEKEHHRSGKPMVACAYAGSYGVPAYFDQSMFPQLLQLQGDTGARRLLTANPSLTASIPFEQGSCDLDTEEDYEKFLAFRN